MNNKKKPGVFRLTPIVRSTSLITSVATNDDKKTENKQSCTNMQPDGSNVEIVNYQKLVVPNGRHNIYWKYFGFPATDEGVILRQDRVICKLCKKQYAYRSKRSLQQHLWVHKFEINFSELFEIPIERPESYVDKFEDEAYINKSNSTAKQQVECIHGDIKENVTSVHNQIIQMPVQDIDSPSCNVISNLSDAINEFVITDHHSPDIVKGKGFQRLIATLSTLFCEIPIKIDKKALEDDIIPRIYESTRADVLNCIANSCSTFALGIEEWKSTSSSVYITISVFFQQVDKGLCIKQLDTILCNPNGTLKDWNLILCSFFAKWNINADQVKTVIKAFTNINLDEALRMHGFVLIPCLVFVLQNLCTTFFFETNKVLDVLIKCRTISAKLCNLTAYIVQDNVAQDFFNWSFSREYPQIWTTTYDYLEYFVQYKDIIQMLFNKPELEFLPHEFLTDEDWTVIEDVVTTLEPIRQTVACLCVEKIPFISLLKPMIDRLISFYLKIKPSDSFFVANLKYTFANQLNLKYNDVNVQSFLYMSTLLDPRLKFYPINDGEKNMPTIYQELVKIVGTERFVIYGAKSNTNKVVTKVPNKNKGLNIARPAVICENNNISLEDRLDLEIAQYKSEPTHCMSECPLLWWSKMSLKYQNLVRLAKIYHVYALSGPSKKLPLESQIQHYINRANLNHKMVDKMMFINANRVDNN